MDTQTYHDAPPGREEVCIYFDPCRELIAAGWWWCANADQEPDEYRVPAQMTSGATDDDSLATFLRSVAEGWMQDSFECGSPQQSIVECNRRRVVRGGRFTVVGMDEEKAPVKHPRFCGCPQCEMATDGIFGAGFVEIDGHHLEIDNDFASSLCETREEWDKQEGEYEEVSRSIDEKAAAQEAAEGNPQPDEFASAWNGIDTDEPSDFPNCLNEQIGTVRRADVCGERRTEAVADLKRELEAAAE